MRVQDILNAKSDELVMISQVATLVQASATMSSRRVGMLMVMDRNGRTVGTLSERALICFIAKTGPSALKQEVGRAMEPIGIIASPDAAVTDVIRIMTDQRARHLPVYSDSKLVGVISIGDILKSRIVEKDQETAVLRDMARVSLAAGA